MSADPAAALDGRRASGDGHGATGRIRPRERDAIVASLRAGVVPRIGQQHLQVGRAGEVAAVVADLDRIRSGGAAGRFVIGEYGSGKTFFLQLARTIALEKRLVTMHADLAPDRRLQATGGRARALYTELTRTMATRARPEGGAMSAVVERFVTQALAEGRATGTDPETVIHSRLRTFTEDVGGYDFAHVVAQYWHGHERDDERLRTDAVRWLRGEFATRAEARQALGVRTIVDDGSYYDHLKLMSRLVRLAGYDGLLICLDELVTLYKLPNAQARAANYEQLLRIVNDLLQGDAAHLGFLFGGTPELLLDTRRGMYSYPALASRLAENSLATDRVPDRSGPVLRLAGLTPEDVYVLLTRLRHVYASGVPADYLVPDEALDGFLRHCARRIGDAWFRTPRETVKGFLDLLALLEQHPDQDWRSLLPDVDLVTGPVPDHRPGPERVGPERVGPERDDELSSFRL